MSDATFWGTTIVVCLLAWCAIAIAAIYAAIAHRPDPWDRPTDPIEEGRRLASQRDDLIAQGVDPADLLIPLAPRDQP